MEGMQFTDEMVAHARQMLGMDSNRYNIAFVGQSGVGKSTLINGFRQLGNNHAEAAPVGEIETTSKIEKYGHPTIPQLVLWDVPGAGTLNHPACTYFNDKMLYAFDCILIICGDRFMQVDFEIAKTARLNRKPCAFGRTKADLAVRAIAQRTHKLMSEASNDLRKKVDESLYKGLKDMGFSTEASAIPYFIISSWAFTRENAYSNHGRHDKDSSLDKMDEEQLHVFIVNLITAREKERRH